MMNSRRRRRVECGRPIRKSAGAPIYDENLMDEQFDKDLGEADMEEETNTEAMIALALGFPGNDLLKEEIEAGVLRLGHGADPKQVANDYIVVRNHILSKWRDNVSTWLTISKIRETVNDAYQHLVTSAFDFLSSRGHINFGLLPLATVTHHNIAHFQPHRNALDRPVSVIVVGAGLAGLAAARQLLNFGFKVIVLEGRSRAGGRAYAARIGSEEIKKDDIQAEGGEPDCDVAAAVDLGGSVITGIDANPLGVLARQLSLPLHKIRDKCPLYWPNGSPVDEHTDAKVEALFNHLLDRTTVLRNLLGQVDASKISLGSAFDTLKHYYGVARSVNETQLLNWHLANLEYANAGQLSMLSLAYWDQDDPYEMGGDHCLLAGGNGKLVNALCQGIPIFYGRPVHSIKYGTEGVEVAAGEQLFRADIALCTVPLGVLKKKIIRFQPELPTRKLEAIDRLGFGLLNKIAMIFPHVFWDKDLDTFGSLNKSDRKRGEYFLFYSYHTVSGGPVLIALVAGESASCFEQDQPPNLVQRVLNVLRGIYGPRMPDPIQSFCTRWGQDPFCYGSYSHVGVGSSGADYDILAECVGDGRLFFAGEATSRQYPATMHGAFLSGLREASRILEAEKKRKIGSPKYKRQKNVDETLSLLFRTPDLSLGKFSFRFDPTNDSERTGGLLRVTVGLSEEKVEEKSKSEAGLELHLYSGVTRQQVDQLKLLQGTDRDYLNALQNITGLNLVSSSCLGTIGGDRLVANLASPAAGKINPRANL